MPGFLPWRLRRGCSSSEPGRLSLRGCGFSQSSHFSFNTLGEVKFRGELRGRTGFAQGDYILEIVIRSAGLLTVTRQETCTTYSRE